MTDPGNMDQMKNGIKTRPDREVMSEPLRALDSKKSDSEACRRETEQNNWMSAVLQQKSTCIQKKYFQIIIIIYLSQIDNTCCRTITKLADYRISRKCWLKTAEGR